MPDASAGEYLGVLAVIGRNSTVRGELFYKQSLYKKNEFTLCVLFY